MPSFYLKCQVPNSKFWIKMPNFKFFISKFEIGIPKFYIKIPKFEWQLQIPNCK